MKPDYQPKTFEEGKQPLITPKEKLHLECGYYSPKKLEFQLLENSIYPFDPLRLDNQLQARVIEDLSVFQV
jgi:hypothetical protein